MKNLQVEFDIENEKEWRHYLLQRLDCLEAKVVKGLRDTSVEIAILKTKAGIWGAVGGVIPVAIIIVLWLIKECR